MLDIPIYEHVWDTLLRIFLVEHKSGFIPFKHYLYIYVFATTYVHSLAPVTLTRRSWTREILNYSSAGDVSQFLNTKTYYCNGQSRQKGQGLCLNLN